MAKVDLAEVKSMIAASKVVIFSKTYCRYCTMAKDVFNRLGQQTTIYELNERGDGNEIQSILGDLTGGTSVPRVFVNEKFIGGGTDVQNMEKDGSLLTLLK